MMEKRNHLIEETTLSFISRLGSFLDTKNLQMMNIEFHLITETAFFQFQGQGHPCIPKFCILSVYKNDPNLKIEKLWLLQEAKDSIDEEDPRRTSSTGSYINFYLDLKSCNKKI